MIGDELGERFSRASRFEPARELSHSETASGSSCPIEMAAKEQIGIAHDTAKQC